MYKCVTCKYWNFVMGVRILTRWLLKSRWVFENERFGLVEEHNHRHRSRASSRSCRAIVFLLGSFRTNTEFLAALHASRLPTICCRKPITQVVGGGGFCVFLFSFFPLFFQTLYTKCIELWNFTTYLSMVQVITTNLSSRELVIFSNSVNMAIVWLLCVYLRLVSLLSWVIYNI